MNPCSRCSFCISSAMRWRSLPYFFCSALIWGCSSCICRVVRICRTNGLYRIARSVKTRNITDSAHAKKFAGPEHEGERLVPNPHDRRHRVVDEVQAEPIKHAFRSSLAALGCPRDRVVLARRHGARVSGPILPDATVHTSGAAPRPAIPRGPTRTRSGRQPRTDCRWERSGTWATASARSCDGTAG